MFSTVIQTEAILCWPYFWFHLIFLQLSWLLNQSCIKLNGFILTLWTFNQLWEKLGTVNKILVTRFSGSKYVTILSNAWASKNMYLLSKLWWWDPENLSIAKNASLLKSQCNRNCRVVLPLVQVSTISKFLLHLLFSSVAYPILCFS